MCVFHFAYAVNVFNFSAICLAIYATAFSNFAWIEPNRTEPNRFGSGCNCKLPAQKKIFQLNTGETTNKTREARKKRTHTYKIMNQMERMENRCNNSFNINKTWISIIKFFVYAIPCKYQMVWKIYQPQNIISTWFVAHISSVESYVRLSVCLVIRCREMSMKIIIYWSCTGVSVSATRIMQIVKQVVKSHKSEITLIGNQFSFSAQAKSTPFRHTGQTHAANG